MKTATIKERVKFILKKYHRARNCDKALVSIYWGLEQSNLIKEGKAKDVIAALLDGRLTIPDNITRLRRKVCEEYPELKGTQVREASRRDKEIEIRNDFRVKNIDYESNIKTKIDASTGQMEIGFEGIRNDNRELH